MNPINPQPPFVWPEPRALENMCFYEHDPPFGDLAPASRSLFGIVSALSGRGIDAIETWMEVNPDLRVCLIVTVYPTCSTRRSDLSRLLDLTERASTSHRLLVHLRPLERVTDRAANALCFLPMGSDAAYLVTGPSEDLGLESRRYGHANFVFRADPALVEAFKRYFDWLWANSREIGAEGAALIPDLLLPKGTEEGARLWKTYMNSFVESAASKETTEPVAHTDPETGDVVFRSEDGKEIASPTEELGFAKLDQLAEKMTRLYEKGALVSIDKLSRVPPLDAPLDPSLFGDASELQRGNVTRRVSMRVSVIDEKTLKEIDKRRQGLRTLLTKFTFGLADNMRWMPATARELFESELIRMNDEGQKLISDLLKGDVDAFIKAKRPVLAADINAMYVQLGRPGQVTEDVVDRVVESLTNRLTKAKSANFMPKLTYSVVSFAGTENALVSPWGQAFSLLADVAAFPRKALTDSFFFRGLKVGEDDLLEAMNVADDELCRNLGARGIKDRCRFELDLLSRIERAPVDSRDRCDLVWRILKGDSIQEIGENLDKWERCDLASQQLLTGKGLPANRETPKKRGL